MRGSTGEGRELAEASRRRPGSPAKGAGPLQAGVPGFLSVAYSLGTCLSYFSLCCQDSSCPPACSHSCPYPLATSPQEKINKMKRSPGQVPEIQSELHTAEWAGERITTSKNGHVQSACSSSVVTHTHGLSSPQPSSLRPDDTYHSG